MPGSESDAPAYREAKLAERLMAAGCTVIDEGDLGIPSYLPHHTVPPMRNWPGPRIVWDLLADRIQPWLHEPGHLPLLIGCDCSVVAGTLQAIRQSSNDVHVLYIDGDFDDAAPDSRTCQSAAAMAVWLITHQSPFWSGPALEPSQVTVFGWSKPSQCSGPGVNSISLAEAGRVGAAEAAQKALAAIPASSNILVHLDIDVMADNEFPAAYFPHGEGFTMGQMSEVLRVVLNDHRIRIIEISGYSVLRDLSHKWIGKLTEMLAAAAQNSAGLGK